LKWRFGASVPRYKHVAETYRCKTKSNIFGLSHWATGNREIISFVYTCVASYACGTWSPTLREGHRLKVFDTRTLKRIFSPFDRKYEETGENFILRSFLILTLSQDYSDDQVQDNKMGVACSTYEE